MIIRSFSDKLAALAADSDRTDQNSLDHASQIRKLIVSYNDIARKLAVTKHDWPQYPREIKQCKARSVANWQLKLLALSDRIAELKAELEAGHLQPRRARSIGRRHKSLITHHGKGQSIGVDHSIPNAKPEAGPRPTADLTERLPVKPNALLGEGNQAKPASKSIPVIQRVVVKSWIKSRGNEKPVMRDYSNKPVSAKPTE